MCPAAVQLLLTTVDLNGVLHNNLHLGVIASGQRLDIDHLTIVLLLGRLFLDVTANTAGLVQIL